jgi:hypothetical protein
MDMEFIDHVARETVVPGWWFPAWDLGLLWSAWVPPRVRNAAAQRLATLIPPGIKDRTARTALQEFAASAQESSTAVLQAPRLQTWPASFTYPTPRLGNTSSASGRNSRGSRPADIAKKNFRGL